MALAQNSAIGASTATWPSGQATLEVTYRPSRTIAAGNTLVTGQPSTLNAEVQGARIVSILHKDVDYISGTGTVPASLFNNESRRGQVRFRPIKAEEPVVVTFAVTTAPTANRDFPTCLAPLDAVLKDRVKTKSRRQFSRAFRRAARRRPGFLRRVGRGILRRINPISWLRGLGMAASPGDGGAWLAAYNPSDSELESKVGEVLASAFNPDSDEDLDEFLGALYDEIDLEDDE